MKIEIWSDVACPFCYIGKRRLEKAISKFNHKDEIEIEWKSFLLNPDLKAKPGQTLNEYLSEIKGWTLEYAAKLNENVVQMAKSEGLDYHLNEAIVANTRNAHRLIQYSKTLGLADKVFEKLMAAYFTQALDVADHLVLCKIAVECGMEADSVMEILNSDAFSEAIEQDLYQAYQLGINSVPFFVFNNTYGIPGAQPEEVFINTLEQAYTLNK
jgi:predicted DsbA family dithiol-disulfide isomerase